MKTKKRLAIFMALVLVLQMMPLPEGSLKGVFGIFNVSSAEEAQPTEGTFENMGGEQLFMEADRRLYNKLGLIKGNTIQADRQWFRKDG